MRQFSRSVLVGFAVLALSPAVVAGPTLWQRVANRGARAEARLADALERTLDDARGLDLLEYGFDRKVALGAVAMVELEADDATTLSSILTSVRQYVSTHPWLEGDEGRANIVAQLDQGLGIAGKLLAAAYAGKVPAKAAPKPGGKPSPAAGPSCPNCRKPIGAGDVFCMACGAAL